MEGHLRFRLSGGAGVGNGEALGDAWRIGGVLSRTDRSPGACGDSAQGAEGGGHGPGIKVARRARST